jgi:hypothetical protein
MGQPKSPAAPARTDDVRPLAPADDAGGAAAVRPDPARPARLDGPR